MREVVWRTGWSGDARTAGRGGGSGGTLRGPRHGHAGRRAAGHQRVQTLICRAGGGSCAVSPPTAPPARRGRAIRRTPRAEPGARRRLRGRAEVGQASVETVALLWSSARCCGRRSSPGSAVAHASGRSPARSRPDAAARATLPPRLESRRGDAGGGRVARRPQAQAAVELVALLPLAADRARHRPAARGRLGARAGGQRRRGRRRRAAAGR